MSARFVGFLIRFPGGTLRRAASLSLALALAAGCSQSASTTSTPAHLSIAFSQEPTSLNPLFMTGAATAVLVPLLYSYLLTLDEHDALQPDAASTVPTRANGGISADGLTITYHLRPGLRWQDGAPLTSRDVAFTFAAIMNPRNNVISRAGYDRVEAVDATGPLTVRVRLKQRYAPILSTFLGPNQNYPILPAHLLAGQPDVNRSPFNTQPIGSGPYRATEWLHGDHLVLRANGTYFRGTPAIAGIDIKFISDSNTTLNELRTHEVGVDLFGDPAYLTQYGSIANDRVVRAPLAGGGLLFFNMTDPTMADLNLRRALVQAIDFGRLVPAATRGAQTFRDAGRSIFSWGYDPSVAASRYDPRAAARAFDAAGWQRGPDGMRRRDGRPLSLGFAFVAGNAVASSVGVQLQQQLQTAGVSLVLHSYQPTQFRAPAAEGGPLYGGHFQLAFIELFAPADPDVQWLLACDQFPPNGFNLMRFCDATTDAAIRAGATTYDRAQRLRASRIVQQRVAAELPLVTLWQQQAVYVVPVALSAFRPAGESPVWNVGAWAL